MGQCVPGPPSLADLNWLRTGLRIQSATAVRPDGRFGLLSLGET